MSLPTHLPTIFPACVSSWQCHSREDWLVKDWLPTLWIIQSSPFICVSGCVTKYCDMARKNPDCQFYGRNVKDSDRPCISADPSLRPIEAANGNTFDKESSSRNSGAKRFTHIEDFLDYKFELLRCINTKFSLKIKPEVLWKCWRVLASTESACGEAASLPCKVRSSTGGFVWAVWCLWERLWMFGPSVSSCCQKRKCQLSPGSRVIMDR